jgi:hypothetical protein
LEEASIGIGLEETSMSTRLEETPIVGSEQMSVHGLKKSTNTFDHSDFQQKKSQVERQLEGAKIIGQDLKRKALQGEALFKKA